MALGAKNKLGFINGSLPKPTNESPDFKKWIHNDYMVMSWLTSSMDQVISNSFIFVTSSSKLWNDIGERFGKSNAPLLYELHTSLSKIQQDNMTIAEYYGKLKNVWDKLNVLEGCLDCNCGAMSKCTCNLLKKAAEASETKKLIQLIYGLNKQYDSVKTNLLSMEPLPSVLKAYHILQQIEKHNHLTLNVSKTPKISAFYSQKSNQNYNSYSQGSSKVMNNVKKDFKKMKLDMSCDYCKRKGHGADQCFKLVGYPDWYTTFKGKTQQASQFSQMMAEMSLTILVCLE
ncbi:uncharacterized protein LOC141702183 [Apium graveolens]|uniref:uncharacterized protein LOC141702183 n=1 Tax=Apium graveolens TaxID=4045 RepID=UPI003D7BEF55